MHCANNPVGICVVGAWIKGRGRESERHWAVLVESKRCHSFFLSTSARGYTARIGQKNGNNRLLGTSG